MDFELSIVIDDCNCKFELLIVINDSLDGCNLVIWDVPVVITSLIDVAVLDIPLFVNCKP